MSPRSRGPWHRLALLATLALLCFSGGALLGMWTPWLSLLAHLQLYALLAWLAAQLLLLVRPIARLFWQPARLRGIGLLLMIGHALPILALYLPPADGPDLASPVELEVVWLNAHHNQTAVRDLEQLLAADPPGLVAICETGPNVGFDLPGLDYSWTSNRLTGMHVASRYPLQNAELLPTPPGARDMLQLDLEVKRRRVRLFAVHAQKPYELAQGGELRLLTERAAAVDHLIVLADLNSSPWSAHFRQLLSVGGLRHGRQGYGLCHSFRLGRLPLLPLPIDHVLYKGDVALDHFEALPWVTSDHRPIRASLRLGTY